MERGLWSSRYCHALSFFDQIQVEPRCSGQARFRQSRLTCGRCAVGSCTKSPYSSGGLRRTRPFYSTAFEARRVVRFVHLDLPGMISPGGQVLRCSDAFHDRSFDHHAVVDELPQGDKQLASHGDDRRFASTARLGAFAEPARQRRVRLVQQDSRCPHLARNINALVHQRHRLSRRQCRLSR